MRQLTQGTLKISTTPRNQKWLIVMGRKVVETVYFDPSMSAEEVRDSLINHDGMSQEIRVIKG